MLTLKVVKKFSKKLTRYLAFMPSLSDLIKVNKAIMVLKAKLPGIIGKSAGKATISAGTRKNLEDAIPKMPIKKLAIKVAKASTSMCATSIKKSLKEWPKAAMIAVKNKTLMGVLQAKPKPKPTKATKSISMKIELILSHQSL